MRIAIEGLGLVGGFGFGADALRNALKGNLPSPGTLRFPYGDDSIEAPAFMADTAPLDQFVTKRSLRRIDHFSRMALLGAYGALDDAGRLDSDPARLAVVVGSGYGASATTFAFLDSFIQDGDSCSSPTHFSNSVHNAAAAHISISLKATGPSLSVSQFEMSVPSALLCALQMLRENRADRVLLGGVDEACAVLGYCRQRFFGAPQGPFDPLDFGRQSAVAGEGAAFLLLSREGQGEARYGYLNDVQMGRIDQGGLRLPEKSALVLGADGHQGCGRLYQSLPIQGRAHVCHAQAYGSLPVGPAFDLAAAALSLKDDRLYPGTESLGDRSLCCLKLAEDGNFGLVSLSG